MFNHSYISKTDARERIQGYVCNKYSGYEEMIALAIKAGTFIIAMDCHALLTQ